MVLLTCHAFSRHFGNDVALCFPYTFYSVRGPVEAAHRVETRYWERGKEPPS